MKIFVFVSLVFCFLATANFANSQISKKYSVSNDGELAVFENKAKDGDNESLYDLGIIYLTGSGVPISREKATSLLRKSSWKDNTKAQVLVAASYTLPGLFGIDLQKQDYPATPYLLDRASKLGDKVATKLLAYGYLFEIPGIKKSTDEKERKVNVDKARDLFKLVGVELSPNLDDVNKSIDGMSFNKVLEDELAQAFGLRLVDGKVVSFDDANYPERLSVKK